MMTRKKGEEQHQPVQENSSAHPTRSTKEKGSQNVSAAAAAAKLEKFAHIPSQSPGKSNQVPPGKGSTGGPGDRKSLGKVADNSAANPRVVTKKSPVKGHSGATMDNTHNVNIAGHQEPTLNEVMGAINACSSLLSEMCTELRGLKEEVSSIRQEIQKVVERISGLEERVSRTEDMVSPMQQDFKKNASPTGGH